jgi:heptaprenylglyceryl phosphate synthase
MKQLEDLLTLLSTKPTWSNKELTEKIKSVKQSITDTLSNNGQIEVTTTSKSFKVETIKKYDIIYVSILGSIPHYCLVYKVIDNLVWYAVITSKEKEFIVHTIKNDRTFQNSFVSNLFFCISKETACESFVRVFESKSEADVIFKNIKQNMLNFLK